MLEKTFLRGTFIFVLGVLTAPAVSHAFVRALMEGLPATNSAILISTGTSPATSAVTVQNLKINQITPNQCLQTASGGLIMGTGSACGTGSGGSTGSINTAVQYSASYYSVTGSSNVIFGLAPGTSGQILTTAGAGGPPFWTGNLPAGSAGYIQNVAALQAGATFYVTSGTVNTAFITNGTALLKSPITVNQPASGSVASEIDFTNNATTQGKLLQLWYNGTGFNHPVQLSNTSPTDATAFSNVYVDPVNGVTVLSSTNNVRSFAVGSTLGSNFDFTVSTTGVATAKTLTVSTLTSGRCVQTGTGGLLTVTGGACGSGGAAAGSSGQLQYNNLAAFGGAANTVVTGSSLSINEPVTVGSLYDSNLLANQPVITDSNKQLVSGNVPLADVSGILGTANGGTNLGSASNSSVLLGNGSAWTSATVPSCSGSKNAVTFNTGTNTFGCNTLPTDLAYLDVVQIWTAPQTYASSITVSAPEGSGVTYGLAVGSLSVTSAGAGTIGLVEGMESSVPAAVTGTDRFWASSSSHTLMFNPNGGVSTFTFIVSSVPIPMGNVLAYNGTNSVLDGGLSVLSHPGLPGQLIFNSNNTLAGSTITVVTASSVTILSSASINNTGTHGGHLGFLDVYAGGTAPNETRPLLTVGSDQLFDQLLVQNQQPVYMPVGASAGQVSVGILGAYPDAVKSSVDQQNQIDFYNGQAVTGEMAIQTSGTKGDIVLLPQQVETVHISSQSVKFSTTTVVQGNFISSGTLPTVGACGTTPAMSPGSTNTAGGVVWSGSASSCAFTFSGAGFKKPPFCLANTSGAAFTEENGVTASSATFVFSASISGSTMTYHCLGGSGG